AARDAGARRERGAAPGQCRAVAGPETGVRGGTSSRRAARAAANDTRADDDDSPRPPRTAVIAVGALQAHLAGVLPRVPRRVPGPAARLLRLRARQDD